MVPKVFEPLKFYCVDIGYQCTFASGSSEPMVYVGLKSGPSSVRHRPQTISSDFSSEAAEPIATSFHMDPPTLWGRKYVQKVPVI